MVHVFLSLPGTLLGQSQNVLIQNPRPLSFADLQKTKKFTVPSPRFGGLKIRTGNNRLIRAGFSGQEPAKKYVRGSLLNAGSLKRTVQLCGPVVPFFPFLEEGSPLELNQQKKGALFSHGHGASQATLRVQIGTLLRLAEEPARLSCALLNLGRRKACRSLTVGYICGSLSLSLSLSLCIYIYIFIYVL